MTRHWVTGRHFVDRTGTETDHFKIEKFLGRNEKNKQLWRCICKACGNECVMIGAYINHRKSCGCKANQDEAHRFHNENTKGKYHEVEPEKHWIRRAWV